MPGAMTGSSIEALSFMIASECVLRQSFRFLRGRPSNYSSRFFCSLVADANLNGDYSIADEMKRARQEARPYNIDVSKLTSVQREELRRKSKSIPLVADKEPLEIVFEDDRFLAVNKPSYVKMHPSHRFEGGSLLNRAIGHCGFTPWLLHRLDMHTTGVVLFAKKKKLCHPIMRQFMAGRVEKEYLCVVDGYSPEARDTTFAIDAPIQRHTISFVREVGSSGKDSKPAKTVYTILDKSSEKKMMLLRAAPQTGRTHQIRVHAKEGSLPIVGDDLYNEKEFNMYASYDEISAAAHKPELTRFGDKNPLRKGLKLHAWKITLRDPESNERISFCAPPPGHMQDLLEWSGLSLPEQ